MDPHCPSCQEIAASEEALDQRADDLVRTVTALCADTRARNRELWERFASVASLPVVGNLIYGLFRAPAGLDPDPEYRDAGWYKMEVPAITEQAGVLERMKAGHMEHWDDEPVDAAFGWDYAGYYTGHHPPSPMPRRDAYKTYDVEGTPERLMVFTPKKYDFTSAAGADKMEEGVFVMDSRSKAVVPLNQCDWRWTALRDTADSFLEKLVALFARSGTVYTLRR